MELSEYQQRAVATALPTALSYDYLIPGLVAEVGEVFGKVAKSVRDEWPRERLQEELKAELGDVCWFWVLLAHLAGTELRELRTVAEDLTEHEVLQDLLSVSERLHDKPTLKTITWKHWLQLYPSCTARVAMVYEIDMQEILEYNINKLESRKARGTLKGSGDVR